MIQNYNEFKLATFLLYKRFNTPHDLLQYWSFAGPCHEKCPDIERIH